MRIQNFFSGGGGKVYLFLPGGTRILSITLNLLFFYINVRKCEFNKFEGGWMGGGGFPDTSQGKFKLI